MVDTIDLPEPAQAQPGTLSWTPFLLAVDQKKGTVKVGYRGDNGEYLSIALDGPEANAPEISALFRRYNAKAIADGKINGTQR